MKHFGKFPHTPSPETLRLLRWIILPVGLGLFFGWILLWSFLPSPSDTAEPVDAKPVLTYFSDDLGTDSTLTFTTRTLPSDALSQGSLVLVNESNLWSFPETALANVYAESNGTLLLSSSDLQLDPAVIPPLCRMVEEFRRVTQCNQLMISEGYRSRSQQSALSRKSDTAVSVGASEYHTGLALSLNLFTEDGTVLDFNGTGESAWILENCSRYGFVLRYPEGKESVTGVAYQPWHLRYVGQPHAYLMNLKDYCLEEYLDYLSHYPFDGPHIQVTDNKNCRYEIYFVAAEAGETTIPVPLEKDYTISGNNRDGFVVTVLLDAADS